MFIVPVVSLLSFTVMGKNDRFRCRDCYRVFRLTYTYEARKPGVKEQITEMAFNVAGVRDTARTLKIGIDTVIRTLETRAKRITSSPVAHADVAFICELDEQWSFVGSKVSQHWLWYAYNTKTGGALAYRFGQRTDETCRELLALLTPFNIGMITSDDWGNYASEVPKEMHLTGKIFTQRIERNNLTLRTRIKRLARRTICFSRSVELHEKVIGAFIENTCSTNWNHHHLIDGASPVSGALPTFFSDHYSYKINVEIHLWQHVS